MYTTDVDGEEHTVVKEIKVMICIGPNGESNQIVTHVGDGFNIAEVYGLLQLEADRYRALWEK